MRSRSIALLHQSSHGHDVRTRRTCLYVRNRILDIAPDVRQLLDEVLVATVEVIDLFELGFAFRDESRKHHADRRPNIDRRYPRTPQLTWTVNLRRRGQQL